MIEVDLGRLSEETKYLYEIAEIAEDIEVPMLHLTSGITMLSRACADVARERPLVESRLPFDNAKLEVFPLGPIKGRIEGVTIRDTEVHGLKLIDPLAAWAVARGALTRQAVPGNDQYRFARVANFGPQRAAAIRDVTEHILKGILDVDPEMYLAFAPLEVDEHYKSFAVDVER